MLKAGIKNGAGQQIFLLQNQNIIPGRLPVQG
jgi:hypothetical protein